MTTREMRSTTSCLFLMPKVLKHGEEENGQEANPIISNWKKLQRDEYLEPLAPGQDNKDNIPNLADREFFRKTSPCSQWLQGKPKVTSPQSQWLQGKKTRLIVSYCVDNRFRKYKKCSPNQARRQQMQRPFEVGGDGDNPPPKPGHTPS